MYGNDLDDYGMGMDSGKLDPIEKIRLGVMSLNEEYGIVENPYGINDFDASGNYLSYDNYGFPFGVKKSGAVLSSFSTLYKELPFMYEPSDNAWLSQFNLSSAEINCFVEVIGLIGALNESRLSTRIKLPSMESYYTKEDIDLLLLIYKIRKNKGEIDRDPDLIPKYLNEVYRLKNVNKSTLSQLERSIYERFPRKFDRYPRRVEIVGIQDPVFSIYNSSNYQKYDKLYALSDKSNVGSESVTIITDKVPAIAWRGSKEVKDVCSLSLADSESLGRDVSDEAIYYLKINREYVSFRPTYYIYISTKKEPGVKVDGLTYNLDYYRLIGKSGAILTVAIGVHQLGKHERNKVPSSENVQEIAYYPDEAYMKLIKVAKEVYESDIFDGFKVEKVQGNCSLEDFLEYTKNMTVEEREAYEYEKSHISHEDEEEEVY